jgi:predicted small lipoprotein YifL
MFRRASLLMLICLLAAPLAGCGQKGPLFLPEPAREQPQQTSSQPSDR